MTPPEAPDTLPGTPEPRLFVLSALPSMGFPCDIAAVLIIARIRASGTRKEQPEGPGMKTRMPFVCSAVLAAVLGLTLVLSGCASNVGPRPSFASTSWSTMYDTLTAGEDAASSYASSPQAGRSRTLGNDKESKSKTDRRRGRTIGGFVEDVELGKIEFKDIDFLNDDVDVKVDDVSRKRAGLGMSFGNEGVQGYFRVFYEELETKPFRSSIPDAFFKDDFEGGGVGGGVKGIPQLAAFNDHIKLILPFRAGIDFGYSRSNVHVDIPSSPPYAGVDEDVDAHMLYAAFSGTVGIGLDIYGVQPSAGFALDALYGTSVIDESDLDSDSFEVMGLNAAGFAELRYKHPDFPLFASVRVLFGNIDGIMVSLGVNF
ncbi:MAG: hypothetical protein JXQ29_06820 [Planctomycetes bacterium]|nr:hypothetical protein [Planctomycetota bacterium]